jgi:hypothetical protein
MSHNSLTQAINCSSFAFLESRLSSAFVCFLWGASSGTPCITKEGEIINNLNKEEFYKYLGINQSNHIQHSIIKENLEKQFYLRIKSIFSTTVKKT